MSYVYSRDNIKQYSDAGNTKIPSNVIEFAKALQKLVIDDFKKNGKKYIKEVNDRWKDYWKKYDKPEVQTYFIPDDAKISGQKDVEAYIYPNNKRETYIVQISLGLDDRMCGAIETGIAKSIESEAVKSANKVGLEPVKWSNRFLMEGDDYFAIECEIKEK